MDRLLRGELPPGGKCDLKTLAKVSGVTRTGFYAKGDRPGPYQHLAAEFHRRLAALRQAGTLPDPRAAQIARLKADNARLQQRIAARDAAIAELTSFKTTAISRLAAQHAELTRLRRRLPGPDQLRPDGTDATITTLPRSSRAGPEVIGHAADHQRT
jgi:hypothetical protein